MKTLTLSVIITMFVSVSIFAQNFQTVYSNRIAFFQPHYKEIVTLRIDSVEATSDSVFYPMGSFQQLDYDCYTPFGDSWIGKKIIIKNDGWNYFFNKNLDTVKIKTNALLNESWTACLMTDSVQIIAKVINFDTITYFGVNDSVKTIEFKAYDRDMNPLSYISNSYNVKISKNYGFVTALNFRLFPGFEDEFFMDNLQEIYLRGLINPKLGFQNLTWFDVFDFQPEDELHVSYVGSYWDGVDGSTTNYKTIIKYLTRTDYADSIVYTYQKKENIAEQWMDSNAYSAQIDTIATTIYQNPEFDKLPGEPIIGSFLQYYYYGSFESFKTKTKPSLGNAYYYDNSCWKRIIGDDCFIDGEYIEGLGGPYFQCTYPFAIGEKHRKLEYFKKGENVWGTPLIFTTVEQPLASDVFKMYPNPANDILYIQFNADKTNSTIQIFDLNGRLVLEDFINSDEAKLSISGLKSGVYYVKITNNKQILKIEKLIIKN